MINTLLLKFRSGLLLLAFSLALSFNAAAQTCGTPPTCESLGYVSTLAKCQGKPLLKCPFDNNKVFCDLVDAKPGDLYYTGGYISKNKITTEIGRDVIGIVANFRNRSLSGGYGGGIPTVVMHPYALTGTWWQVKAKCDSIGGSLHNSTPWKSEMNQGLAKLGLPAMVTTNVWGDEVDGNNAMIWNGSSGTRQPKSSSATGYCFFYLD